jgi:hypothetical protein
LVGDSLRHNVTREGDRKESELERKKITNGTEELQRNEEQNQLMKEWKRKGRDLKRKSGSNEPNGRAGTK